MSWNGPNFVNFAEDYQWRRERERVMAKAGPAASTPLKPNLVSVNGSVDSAVVANGVGNKNMIANGGAMKPIPNKLDISSSGKKIVAHYSNGLSNSSKVFYSPSQERKSPEEAAKTLDKWLAPKVAADTSPAHQVNYHFFFPSFIFFVFVKV